jgi:hypothetical protein
MSGVIVQPTIPVQIANAAAAPFQNAAAVTPSNSVALAATTRALYVGGAGTLTVIMAAGQTVEFLAVPAGTTLPIAATQVMSTGTSATSIVALW